MISVGDLRPGTTFEYDGNLYIVLDYSHNKKQLVLLQILELK